MSFLPRKKPAQTPRRRHADSPSGEVRQRSDATAREAREQRYGFRRNQTLTGSKSSSVSSAGDAGSAQMQSPRAKAHELVQYRRNIGVILFGVLLALTILAILVWNFTATVVIRTNAPLSFDEATYSKYVDDYLRTRPAERLRFALNEARLHEYLQTVAPEIGAMRADGNAGIGVSRFAVTFRDPIAGWNVGGTNQYVDAAGVAFAKNYSTDSVIQIDDESGIRATAGQAVASDRFLSFVGRMTSAVGKQGYIVERIVIPRDTARQVELYVKEVKYPTKVSIDRAVGEQAEDMARSIRWFESRSESPKYLDVRVSGRAFYR